MFDIKSFYRAASVKDAVSALQNDPDAEIISGGTDVLIRVREGKDAGRSLVSIHDLSELKFVKEQENGDLWIGAGTAFSHITNDPIIKKRLNMLGEAVDMVGGPQIRNTGTIGGNICNGATSADSAASMWALDAEIVLEGSQGERTVNIKDFYTGPGKTVRDRCEVCKYFVVRRENIDGWQGCYIKYGKRNAMEIATLGCAVRVKLSQDKSHIEGVRLAYGVAGPTPLRCYAAEAALTGRAVSDASIFEEFGRLALTEVKPRSSWRASKEFRLQLIEELAKRGLWQAILRAGGAPAAELSARYSGRLEASAAEEEGQAAKEVCGTEGGESHA